MFKVHFKSGVYFKVSSVDLEKQLDWLAAFDMLNQLSRVERL